VGQVGALAFAVGAGFFIASGFDGAVASASPGDSGHSGVGSSAPSHSASSGAHRASEAARVSSTHTALATPSASAITTVPASVSTSLASAKATPTAPHLPTPVEVQQAVLSAVQTARRDLTAVEHQVENGLTGLGRALGVVKPAKPTIYGSLTYAQYWSQQSAENCVLMATASVIGQLTGTKVTEATIVGQATTTQSVVNPTRKIYLGLDTDDRVAIGDAEQLLKLNGIDASTTDYKKTQGLTALRALEKDLKAGDAVMVGVNAGTIWNAEDASPTPGAVAESADHEISVIAINATTKTVYVNDSGIPNGAGLAVPLAVFMRAWQADSFETTAAVLAQASTAAIAA
jgi:hypothetical protein